MRKGWIGGNWKMQKLLSEASATASDVVRMSAEVGDSVDVVIYPPFPYLMEIVAKTEGSPIQVGGQNLSDQEYGALTGDVSGPMLKSVGCTSVLVGHSERRHIFGESNDLIAKKLKMALKADLDAVLCVGETLEQRESNQTEKVVTEQVRSALAGIGAEEADRITVAYEPVWAIGTGKVATPEQAVEVHKIIRDLLGRCIGKDYADRTRIHYGGSVKVDNIETLVSNDDIDGTLVGGASLDAGSFAELVQRTGVAKAER